jgi:hypothetical protein
MRRRARIFIRKLEMKTKVQARQSTDVTEYQESRTRNNLADIDSIFFVLQWTHLSRVGHGKSVVAHIVAANLPGAALGVLVLAAVAFGARIGHLHEVRHAVSLVGCVISVLHLVVNFNYILS